MPVPHHVLIVDQALATVRAGEWTTYGALAAVADTGPRIVGMLMASGDFESAHRVLTAGGVPSSGFGPAQRRLLEDEEVDFDALGRADPAARVDADVLAARLSTVSGR